MRLLQNPVYESYSRTEYQQRSSLHIHMFAMPDVVSVKMGAECEGGSERAAEDADFSLASLTLIHSD